MRYEKGTFAVIPNLEQLKGLNPMAQAVYLWLCSHANQDGECFPSKALLAKEAGIGIRSVPTAVAQLEKAGIVLKESRPGDKGNSTNLYTVIIGGVQDVHWGGAPHARPGVQDVHAELYPLSNSNPSNYPFEVFWSMYPKKAEKKKAEASWSRLPEKTREMIMADLPKRKESDSWKRGYVLNPMTYLNGERWNDEIISKRPEAQGSKVDKF